MLSRCIDPAVRLSFSAPKVLHLLSCSPSSSHLCLEQFDLMLRSAVQCITNCDLSDVRWIQASLPVKDGGLGVKRVSSLALPAFLASAASILSLQDDILSGCTCSDSVFLQSYLADWSTSIRDTLPLKQPFWDHPGILADQARVKSSLSTPLWLASFWQHHHRCHTEARVITT